MDATYACADCGRDIRREVQFGLCPACLLKSFLTTSGVFAPENVTSEAEQLRQNFCVGEGRFRLVERLGEGGMGQVWLAEDSRLDRKQVALKFVSQAWGNDPHFINELRQELIRTRDLQDKHIVKVHDWHEHPDEAPFISMEYVTGMPLSELLSHFEHGLPYRRLHPLLMNVCQALTHAHQQGIIHRDIKPGNILTFTTDGVESAKVSDFGLGKIVGDHQPATGGTQAFMSQAQAAGEIPTPSDDIFSLGATMYQLLTGQLPYGLEGCQHNPLIRLESLPNSRNRLATVPGTIVKLIGSCLQKDPQYRPDSMEAVYLKLKAFPPLLDIPVKPLSAWRDDPETDVVADDAGSDVAPLVEPVAESEAEQNDVEVSVSSEIEPSTSQPRNRRLRHFLLLASGLAVAMAAVAFWQPSVITMAARWLARFLQPTQILVSSDFQDPEIATNNLAVYGPGNKIAGWVTASHDVSLIDGTLPNRNLPSTPAGEQYLEIGRDGGNGGIERSVSLASTGTVTLTLRLAGNEYPSFNRRGEITVIWVLNNIEINREVLAQAGREFTNFTRSFQVPKAGDYLLRIQNNRGTGASIDDVMLSMDSAKDSPAIAGEKTTPVSPTKDPNDGLQLEKARKTKVQIDFSFHAGPTYTNFTYELYSLNDRLQPKASGAISSRNTWIESIDHSSLFATFLLRIHRGTKLVPWERVFESIPGSNPVVRFGGRRMIKVDIVSASGKASYSVSHRHDSWETSRPGNTNSGECVGSATVNLMSVEGLCQITVSAPGFKTVTTNVLVIVKGDSLDDDVPIRVPIVLERQSNSPRSGLPTTTVPPSAKVPPRTNYYDAAGLEDYFRRRLPEDGTNSYAWLAMENGKAIASGAVGRRRTGWDSPSETEPVTLNSTTYVTYMDDVFLAYGLARLRQLMRGTPKEFSYDDPVRPYLVKVVPKIHRGYDTMTFAHLKERRTGIRNAIGSTADLQYALNRPPRFAPGTDSDLRSGIDDEAKSAALKLLPFVIGQISGQCYSDFMRSNVFVPLKMMNTFTRVTGEPACLEWKGWRSSVEDLGKFHRATRFHELVARSDPYAWGGLNWWVGGGPMYFARNAESRDVVVLSHSPNVNPWDAGGGALNLPVPPRLPHSTQNTNRVPQ